MAYRRNITSRAKLLYQQRSYSPSFAYVHREDDRKSSTSPVSEDLGIPRCIPDRCLGSGTGIWNISRNLLQDRRFSRHHAAAMIPGLGISRYMSTSVGEGADKLEYMSDVAEVLADKAVEAVSQVPGASEVAIAAAGSFPPVAALQYMIDYVHSFTGLGWWASIVMTTFLIRTMTLPVMVNLLKSTSKLTILRPQLEKIKDEMQNKDMSPTAVAEGQERMKALFKEYGVTPFTPFKGLLIQGPIFMSFFLAIRNMVEKVPSFKQGGAFWFTDLTAPDDLYIFPVLTALTFWITVEEFEHASDNLPTAVVVFTAIYINASCNAQEGLEGNPAGKTIKNVSRGFAALTIPFTAGFPQAIFCYWVPSNLFSLVYGLVMKKPAVKKLLGIPIITVTPPPDQQKPAVPFFETMKKVMEAQKHHQTSLDSTKASAEVSKSTQQVASSAVLSQRIRSLEKQVKGRKRGKKR